MSDYHYTVTVGDRVFTFDFARANDDDNQVTTITNNDPLVTFLFGPKLALGGYLTRTAAEQLAFGLVSLALALAPNPYIS